MKTFRLVTGVLIFIVLIVFISFNLDNKVDVSFWSKSLIVQNVPVYLVIFSSFICGIIFTLPFTFFRKVKYLYAVKDEDEKALKKRKNRKKIAEKSETDSAKF